MVNMKNLPHNLYIHVPYCMSKCNYCAFMSVACAAPDWGKYADDICGEIMVWAQKLGKIDILASKVDSLAHDVELLKLKVLPNDVKENNTFATANAIQVRIDENIRMLAELHAR